MFTRSQKFYPLSVMETEGPSVLRFVTTDLETTKAVLTSLGSEFNLTEVLAVPLENRTGSLAKVLERLAAEHINVEYAYVSTMATPGKSLVRERPGDASVRRGLS